MKKTAVIALTSLMLTTACASLQEPSAGDYDADPGVRETNPLVPIIVLMLVGAAVVASD